MTTKTSHTPTPWHVCPTIIGAIEICDNPATQDRTILAVVRRAGTDSESLGTYPTMQANAAHIVRCVNEREQLLAALEACKDRLEEMDCGPEYELAVLALAQAEREE